MQVHIFSPTQAEWIQHIQGRLLQAKEIKLLPSDFTLDFSTAITFAPSTPELPSVSSSINEILNVEIKPGWNYRQNEIRSAAEWIAKEAPNNLLVLEGGFARHGDKYIENIPHEINGDGVLFTLSSNAPVEEIETLLRRSVSIRILGKVGHFFICDALDCDSVAITSGKTQQIENP